MTNPLFLTYRFNGWLVEFRADHVEVVSPINGDRYKISCDPYSSTPFLIVLLEKGRGTPPEWT